MTIKIKHNKAHVLYKALGYDHCYFRKCKESSKTLHWKLPTHTPAPQSHPNPNPTPPAPQHTNTRTQTPLAHYFVSPESLDTYISFCFSSILSVVLKGSLIGVTGLRNPGSASGSPEIHKVSIGGSQNSFIFKQFSGKKIEKY